MIAVAFERFYSCGCGMYSFPLCFRSAGWWYLLLVDTVVFLSFFFFLFFEFLEEFFVFLNVLPALGAGVAVKCMHSFVSEFEWDG